MRRGERWIPIPPTWKKRLICWRPWRSYGACYRDLIDKTVPLTKKNTVSYSIENIGKGRISYVAKLTTEQSTELLSQLRTLISCGMDAEYREELSQVTFARGFVVALYQNADGEDISVYIKGTIIYPDGDRRSLKWQWSFTPDGQTQTFRHYVAGGGQAGYAQHRRRSSRAPRTRTAIRWNAKRRSTSGAAA